MQSPHLSHLSLNLEIFPKKFSYPSVNISESIGGKSSKETSGFLGSAHLQLVDKNASNRLFNSTGCL